MSAEVDAAVDTSLPAAAIDNAADADSASAPEPERSEAVNEEASKRREQEEALSAMKRWKLWAEAKRLWNAESASKAIDFLQEHELVEPTAVGVARMLRLKAGRGGFDKQVLGEYLSKKKPFNEEVRRAFSETFDFTGMTFVEALREYVTTFRLPGESMLIERLFATFAARFYRNNPGDFCPAQLTEEKIEQLRAAFESFGGVEGGEGGEGDEGTTTGADSPRTAPEGSVGSPRTEQKARGVKALWKSLKKCEILHDGWMTKRGAKRKSWQRRPVKALLPSLVRFLPVSQYLLELASGAWVLECDVLTSRGV